MASIVRRPAFRAALLCAVALLAGCQHPWKIVEVRRVFRDEGEEQYMQVETVLLDARNGMTWMLYPIEAPGHDRNDNDHGHAWVPVPRFGVDDPLPHAPAPPAPMDLAPQRTADTH